MTAVAPFDSGGAFASSKWRRLPGGAFASSKLFLQGLRVRDRWCEGQDPTQRIYLLGTTGSCRGGALCAEAHVKRTTGTQTEIYVILSDELLLPSGAANLKGRPGFKAFLVSEKFGWATMPPVLRRRCFFVGDFLEATNCARA